MGAPANAKIKEFWYSAEGTEANKRHQEDPKTIATLTEQVGKADETVGAAVKRAEAAEAEAKALKEQAEQDAKTGNSFLRWIGGLFNSKDKE